MEYRRFGKTGKKISVITLGGMRYKNAWKEPRHVLPEDTLEQCTEAVKTAFLLGINHIETAYGYGKSEHTYGKVLNEILKIPRPDYLLMTKGAPDSARSAREMVEKQLKALQTSFIDFYAWHGMNSPKQYEIACKKNGPVEELHKMKQEGIIGNVGFSTHAQYEVIIKAIETDLFEFINLHYYYFFQRNKGAVDLAVTKDMGIFIISPNDKGGQLFKAPQTLSELTAPLTPMQFNARFCLSYAGIHTLTFGFPVTASFDEVDGIFPTSVPLCPEDALIKYRLDGRRLLDPYSDFDGYSMTGDPSGINIPEILRFRTLWKCYGMKDFGIYRYNMFQEFDNWFAGGFPTPEKLAKIDLSRCPEGIPLVEMLRETHEALYKPKF
jgi:predicted aldo/keto reductase-like oxidoreductase